MIINKLKIKYFNQKGFTMVETLAYLFITSMLLLLISSLIINIFNARRQFKASESVDRNARYIMNFVLNKVHNVDLIDKLSEESNDIYFYDLPERRFNFSLEAGNLIYREVEDTGSGFPDQSTALPQNLNTSEVVLSDLNLISLENNLGLQNQGVSLSFVLTVGTSSDRYGFAQENFSTFFSIR
jgi:competence protein ComGC